MVCLLFYVYLGYSVDHNMCITFGVFGMGHCMFIILGVFGVLCGSWHVMGSSKKGVLASQYL